MSYTASDITLRVGPDIPECLLQQGSQTCPGIAELAACGRDLRGGPIFDRTIRFQCAIDVALETRRRNFSRQRRHHRCVLTNA